MEYFHISASFIACIQFYIIVIGFFVMVTFFTSNETLLLIVVLKYIYPATFRNHITPIMHISKKNPEKIIRTSKQTIDFSTSQC